MIAAAAIGAFPGRADAAPCDPPIQNAIVCENSKPGNPPSEWDVDGAGDPAIQGFATDISVDQGQTVHFKVDTSVDYHLDIYRMGYYGGDGARKVDTVEPTSVLPQDQPDCLDDPATGLVDCGNWAESASWTVPTDATSGIYFAKLVREDVSTGGSHVFFIVRDDDGQSDLLFQTSDTTWQAYNQYGGNSLYTGSPAGRAFKVSYNRPFTTRGPTPEDSPFNAEYPMIRWLERNGYDVSYFTGVDSDRFGSEILEHKAFLSVGHDEYWSGDQRANVTAARDAGVNLAFLSGNEIFWKTRWEDSIDGSATDHRTLVSYKETHANDKIDPTSAWTGTWRDPRPINPEGPNPENSLSGNIFMVNSGTSAIEVPAADGKMRLWRDTSIASLPPGDTATLADDTLGYEWDEDLDNGARPAGLARLSSTARNGVEVLQDNGSTYGSGTATHHLTQYRAPSGALVFGAGTIQWSWGLDGEHDRGGSTPDPRMQQATVNLLADMGAQPDTLHAGLVAASASNDTTAPTSQVQEPLDGASIEAGHQTTISGTASDVSGGEGGGAGQVGGVEVSVDGGNSWHPAEGRDNWTYSWTPGTTGSVTIKSRAVDDSGNLESPGGGVTVDVIAGSCPCSIWGDSGGAPAEADPSAVELGVKFRSQQDGFITGLRFYKGAGNDGAHVGHLWTAAGNLLAEATFSGESASGWQQVSFTSPVPISAGTTYVASYHAPQGNYSASNGYFADSGVDSVPLRALQDGEDGANGVYNYGPSGVFPTDTFGSSNYWVDVVFETDVGPDTTPPTVSSRTPANNATGVATGTNVTATFSEPMDAATIDAGTFQLRDASNDLVPATVTYNPSNRRATLDPDAPLQSSTAYTATIKGGAGGVADASGNVLANDSSWGFTAAAPPPPPPDEGPGGPILVVSGASDPFGRYYAEILRAEGLNEFNVTDLGNVSASVLDDYDVVVLGEVGLGAAQVQMLSDWVQAGGNLIAMRPDPQLAGLLGLTDTPDTLANAYLRVDTGSAPGEGIVGQTIQFHGVADRYATSSAETVASLYSDASTATSNPAVTLRNVGPNGGQAAAFTYDLARSVVYTRQGNPAWAGQERDGESGPIRSDDLFFGAASSDPQPDWVDLNKVAIPQADEQQRLLTNLIEQMNADRKPLPRFWFLPRGKKAAVVMTGDDHGNGGTAGRFDQYKALSPPGCSVADWECVRSSSYIYPSTPLTDAQAAGYTADGFEIGIHPGPGCGNFTPSSLEADFAGMLFDFATKYASVPPPSTSRTHCIAWSDWASQPKVELDHGIRLDTNYYYWPPGWVQDRPGMFTGSGMPMRFADLDGTMIDVYQAATQMTDESGQSYPLNIDALLDKALGPEGYYGVFTANMHTDSASSSGSDAIVASAQARGVPIVSGRQMLEWLDGRNGSSFGSLSWAGNKLGFTIDVGAGANGLQAMVPTSSSVGTLTGVERNGTPITTATQTIKGVEYAFFDALPGSYEASYAVDDSPPAISNVVASAAGDGNATISWDTNEASDSQVDYGTDPDALGSSATDAALTVSHSIQLTGLQPNTTYHFRVRSADAVGNASTDPAPPQIPRTFTTPSSSFTDTTVADFGAGSTGPDTYISETEDGEVTLQPTEGAEFAGPSLPIGWASDTWESQGGGSGGSATVSGGALHVDGAYAGTTATYGAGRSLEFAATFGASTFQHVAFTDNFNSVWAMFSTRQSTNQLYASTNDGAIQDTPVGAPGQYVGSAHRYRIEWDASEVRYFIDGGLVATHSASFGPSLNAAASDFTAGGPELSLDWMRVSPYPAAGSFESRVFDAGQSADWGALSWNAEIPSGAGVAMSVRTGNTPTPDASWSSFAPIASSGDDIPGNSRYVQYRAQLSSSDAGSTPALTEVTIGYNQGADTEPPTITQRSPAPDATDVAVDTDVEVQFSEPMDPATIDGSSVRLRKQGAGSDVAASVSYAGNTATLDPDADLDPSTSYDVTVDGAVGDSNGNPLGADDSWSFTTAAQVLGFTDTTVADFGAGTPGAGTYVSETANGEVILKPAVGEEFSGSELPSGWSSHDWAGDGGGPGGAAAVSGGSLHVDGAFAAPDATFGPGHSLEFVATFGATSFQHVGFGVDFNNVGLWAMFSTSNTTNQLYARTNFGGGESSIPIPGSFLGAPHRYRIDWTATGVTYFIDGTQVDARNGTFGQELHPAASDFNAGGPEVAVDWLRMSPYPGSGSFESRIFDAGAVADWGGLTWNAETPGATGVALSVRTGDTPSPDGTWSDFTPIGSSGGDIPGSSRYLQYRAELSSANTDLTPSLGEVSIVYSPHVDDPPSAVNDQASLAEDSDASPIDVLANDQNADGGPLAIASATQPDHGTVEIANDNQSLTYKPDPDYCNDGEPSDDFTYKLNGGSQATVAVSVACVDDPPSAVNDQASLAEDSDASPIDVLANDQNADGGPLAIASATQPDHGTVEIANDNQSLTYKPDPDYCNDGEPSDDFTYKLNGGSQATVAVSVACVDDPPSAVNDQASLAEDSDASPIDVLANDQNADGGPLAIASATQPDHGTVEIANDNQSLTYKPDPDYCNDGEPSDDFTYKLNGGSQATVAVSVACVDDPPSAVNDQASLAEDSDASPIDVLANDQNADGGPLAIASATQPDHGTVEIANDNQSLTYKPDPDYCNDGEPSDDFTYKLNGGSQATVAVSVACVDDPPSAVNDQASLAEDSDASPIDVLANDQNADGGPLAIASATQPDHGTVEIANDNQSLTYKPDPDYCNDGEPSDDFTYKLNGGSQATVAVSVACVDDPPSAVNDQASLAEDSDASPIDVLANDQNADGGPLAIASATQPDHGTVEIANDNQSLTYKPDPDYCNDGEPSDDFTYKLNGGSQATVAVSVACVDDPPSAVNDQASLAEDSDASPIDVLANDQNADGGPLAIASATQPDHGTVEIANDNQSLTYKPDPDYCNDGEPSDDFTYKLNGGSQATVAVSVDCVDLQGRISARGTVSTAQGTAIAFSAGNDCDAAQSTGPNAIATTGGAVIWSKSTVTQSSCSAPRSPLGFDSQTGTATGSFGQAAPGGRNGQQGTLEWTYFDGSPDTVQFTLRDSSNAVVYQAQEQTPGAYRGAAGGVWTFAFRPHITGTDPDSPANDNHPKVKGWVPAGDAAEAKIYTNSTCSGPPAASGTMAQFTGGIAVPVPDDATTTLAAKVSKANGTVSPCSAPFSYTEDSTPPPAPQITGTDPDSPANNNHPKVKGEAAADTTIRIYKATTVDDCTPDNLLTTGTQSDFASPGLTIEVADNSTTYLRASAADAAGNTSICSARLSYLEESQGRISARGTVSTAQGTAIVFSATNDCDAAGSTRPIVVATTGGAVIWSKSTVTESSCSDQPPSSPLGFDSQTGTATGSFGQAAPGGRNGQQGTLEWTYFDGSPDTVQFTLRDSSNAVVYQAQEQTPGAYRGAAGGVWTYGP